MIDAAAGLTSVPSDRPEVLRTRGGGDGRGAAAPAVWPGRQYPLGAIFDGAGVNFSVFSEAAERVELCLFDEDGRESRVDLPEVTAFCWHGYIPGVQPGQRYGFRVHGPWDPGRGVRCNPAKLLLDPYAKAIEGQVRWSPAVFPYPPGGDDTQRQDDDSAPYVPRSVVTNPFFDWGNDRPPSRPWHETVIYEAHVKGLTRLHPEIPPELRGTYAGLAHPVMIDYLQRLGVTAIELLPVHQFVHDSLLLDRGLRNYWGYNSIGYFAPHNEYAASGQFGQQVQEFKTMVKTLHEAGIEVLLDVVYNHTAEGNHLGPVLSFKGIDNAAYYRLMPDQPRYYMDYTGTGNSLNMLHPHVLQLILDSLRYWVTEMHVDGFRFDLASTLARELHEVDRLSSFFDLIQQDPVVNRVKLIAEPWDVGEGGYQVGNFPPLWSEWNGKYRDSMRDYWRGEGRAISELANRLAGSSDLYATTGRKPFASINFVTAHDGFTLRDLVSYNEKHNEANGEENRDGESHNRSWNCGAEGATDDPAVLELRSRQQRNFLATLFLSQGVPMLLGGDEIGRTQRGNNNGYCQDNEISWFDWEHADRTLLEFTASLVQFRARHPLFRRPRFFFGRSIRGTGVSDILWLRPDGLPMEDQDWNAGFAKSLGVLLNGKELHARDDRGEMLTDDTFYLMFNAHHEPVAFTLPASPGGDRWVTVLDTSDGRPVRAKRRFGASELFPGSEEARREDRERFRESADSPEDALDDLAAVVARTCEAPIALITVLDGEGQVIKSRFGIGPGEPPTGESSFWDHAAVHQRLIEVPDASLDPRFSSHPWVTGEPGIRSCMAAPLLTANGVVAGAICVLDTRTRGFTPEQKAALEALGRQAVALMELRRQVTELEQGRAHAETHAPGLLEDLASVEPAGAQVAVAGRTMLLVRLIEPED